MVKKNEELETPEIEVTEEDVSSEEEVTDNKVRKISISLPASLVEKTEAYATEKGLKRSQVVAKALEEGLGAEDRVFKKLDKIEALIKKQSLPTSKTKREIEEPNPTDEQREKLETLLKDCEEFGGFEIEDEEGFIALCQERNVKGDMWTPEYLTKLAEKLKIGYDGYLVKPDRDELLNRCAKAMKLNEEQKEILSEEFNELFAEEASEEEEEEW